MEAEKANYPVARMARLLGVSRSGYYTRNAESIARETDLDGVYVIRTSVPEDTMTAGESVRVYKSLANVEKIFKTLESRDLSIRPIHHYTENRTRAHVFLCMLAGHLTWHLREALKPLTFTDEDRPVPANPVTPATRSTAARTKASTRKLPDGTPAMGYQALLRHLVLCVSFFGVGAVIVGDDGPILVRSLDLVSSSASG